MGVQLAPEELAEITLPALASLENANTVENVKGMENAGENFVM